MTRREKRHGHENRRAGDRAFSRSPARRLPPARPTAASAPRGLLIAACALLVLANIAIYAQSLGFEFVNYDDEKYVSANPIVAKGVTLEGIRWCLTSFLGSHWHPLTWLTHMLDCQVWGSWAGGHHLTNLLLHIAGTVLLFLLMVRLTGTIWPNALLAALFSLRPLRVESVVWIAERKDVLSAFLFIVTLWAYALFVARPSRGRHAGLLGAFSLAILAKPMVVTLPCVLLLMDYWPLGRLRLLADTDPQLRFIHGQPVDAGRTSPLQRSEGVNGRTLRVTAPLSTLVLEKAPLFALSLGATVVALFAQRWEGSIQSAERLGLASRLGNAVVSYALYIAQSLWPRGLAVFYPYEPSIPGWKIALSVCFLALVTALAIALALRAPAFITGWLWYLGTLVPVIGIVQVGVQAHADRYTYLPSIGLSIALVHGLLPLLPPRLRLGEPGSYGFMHSVDTSSAARVPGEAGGAGYGARFHTAIGVAGAATRRTAGTARPGGGSVLAGALGAGACCLLVVLSWRQASYWRNSVALFQRAVAVTKGNGLAHYNLGCALANAGRTDEAIAQYIEAIRVRPDYSRGHHNLGLSLSSKGRIDEAIERFRTALRLDPDYGDAHLNLGVTLAMKGRLEEARGQLAEASRLMPDSYLALYNLGLADQETGRNDEAFAAFSRAIELRPDSADAHFGLADILTRKGRIAEAVTQLKKTLSLRPDYPGAAAEIERIGRSVSTGTPRRDPEPPIIRPKKE